jgi:hypothetical protein
LALAFAPKASRAERRQKWYITGGRTESGIRDDCHVEPLVSYGADRVEAILNSGITVWSEEEWKRIEPLKEFKATCTTTK